MPGRELKHQLLAKLLLRDLLGTHRDPGERGEFLFMLLQIIGKRGALQSNLDVLAFEALPVEGGGARRSCMRGEGGDARAQHRAAAERPAGPCRIVLHYNSPRPGRRDFKPT